MAHTIRLREPWQLHTHSAGGSSPPPLGGQTVLQFTRKFNAPSGLGPTHQVAVEIALKGDVQLLAASLNEHCLADASAARSAPSREVLRYPIRALMQPFNLLRLTLGFPSEAARLPHKLENFAEIVLSLTDNAA